MKNAFIILGLLMVGFSAQALSTTNLVVKYRSLKYWSVEDYAYRLMPMTEQVVDVLRSLDKNINYVCLGKATSLRDDKDDKDVLVYELNNCSPK